MTWIFFSLILFFASNFLYLTIRKAQKAKIATSIYSVAMFLIPGIFYLIAALFTRADLILPLWQLILIFLAALLWSYLGNFFSQKGILYAPNPGYSLIIQKSYAFLTTLLAVFLFASEFSILKFLGIIIILIFVGLIALSNDNKNHPHPQKKWVLFSIGAHLCFAFGSLISKYFLNIGLKPYSYLFYISALVGILNLVESKKQKIKFKFNKIQWSLIFLIGFFSFLFNLSFQFAYKFAPNPGYPAAINAGSIMSLTLFSALIFKDKLSIRKLIGVGGVLVGLLVLIFI